MKSNKTATLIKGILKENPVFVLVLGTCPTLALTTSVVSAFTMGLSAMFVLICSNIVISALRKVIPDMVRIPCYIVIIATFVTLVQMILEAYLPSLYDMMGVYLALIVVNCIILGRAEMFAHDNNVVDSALDGIGMGIGFTLALISMATIREVLGSGSFAGIEIPILKNYSVSILTMSPGGFFVFGLMIAIVNKLTKGKLIKKKEFGCVGCPMAKDCNKLSDSAEAESEA